MSAETSQSTGSPLSAFFKLLVGCAVLGGLCWAAVAIAENFAEEAPQASLTTIVQRGDLTVTVRASGLVESAENHEIKSKVRGRNAVLWIIENGTVVQEGDELVRLDSLRIQEQIDERTKYANWSQSGADASEARVARATIAIKEYEEGRYRTQLMRMEKDVAIAQAALQNAKDRLTHSRMMAGSGYLSKLEVEEREFAVDQAKLNVELMSTQLDVLKNFTRKEQAQTLKGDLEAVTATHGANVERAMADASRRDRAIEEIQYCTLKADRAGLVIHPNAADWEAAPVAEGSNVYQDQILLLMPDLNQMQVKIGVHETEVKRVKNGQVANVQLPDEKMIGTVSDVASITKPAGWWTGNQVRYDTIVTVAQNGRLRPGMSAEVEIIVAEYENELLIPVASIVEQGDLRYCWVQSDPKAEPERRKIGLGDTNEIFTIIKSGLQEGDTVLLNPSAYEKPIADETESAETEDDTAEDKGDAG